MNINPNTSGLKRGGSPGRPKGTPNKATTEMRRWALSLMNDPEFRQTFEAKWRRCELPAGVVSLMFAYAVGRPQVNLAVAHVTLEEFPVPDAPDDDLVVQAEEPR